MQAEGGATREPRPGEFAEARIAGNQPPHLLMSYICQLDTHFTRNA
jgi:hypothetical protein